MRSASEYKQLGIATWHHDHARYFERLWTNLGWNEDQITEGLKFGANYKGDGSEEDISKQFKELAAVIEAPDIDMAIDVGLGLRDSINMNGLESLPPLPAVENSFTKDDEARLAEIRQTIRGDPSAYDGLQAEQLTLLEAQQAAGGKVSTGKAVVASAAPSGDRLEQIREMRRNDPDAYNADKGLQAQELALIEASLPAASTGGATSEGTASNE